MKHFIKTYSWGLILLTLSIIIALIFYKDYGVSWDEPIERGVGLVTYNYVFHGDLTLKTYIDRPLGTGFELPLVLIEKALKLKDLGDIYLMRHLVTHLFFLLSAFFGYVLVYKFYKNQFLACLGFIMLAFCPRIYAHSYFNTKDIPFLAMFTIVFTICYIAFEKDKRKWYLLLGAACGYATSIRGMGILLMPTISLFFIIDIIRSYQYKEKFKKTIINFLAFIVAFCAVLYITWPILWSAPLHYFKEEFTALAHIHWDGNVLFNGTVYSGHNLPWFYVPGWFAITVPILWLLAGAIGSFWIIVTFIKSPASYLTNTSQRNFILYMVCLTAPVLAVIVLNSVNYDDWRHLYFIYPSFVMIALFAIHKLYTSKLKMAVQLLCTAQVIIIGVFMIKAHPFQQVYFNEFVSRKKEFIRKHYDLEYWGCAYKEGLAYIASHDTSSVIKVADGHTLLTNNITLLSAADRKRIIITDDGGNPDYYITNFRWHPDDYNYPKVFYKIEVENNTIMCVYKTH